MRKIDLCRRISTINEFAPLVGFSPSSLAYLLYVLPATAKYTSFSILKKGGGSRLISAPIPQLSALQRNLHRLIKEMFDEAVQANTTKWLPAHGFREGFSAFSNALPHTNRRYVVNIDVKDFFGSINFGRVRGFFIHDRDFALSLKASTLIAQIACHNNCLPQGSPSSPILSNLIGGLLDVAMIDVAKISKCCYTRYADDLTFSTNAKLLPESIGAFVAGRFTIGLDLEKAFTRAGFVINAAKNRACIRGSQQTVTGYTVNEKVNISQLYWRRTRAMAHSLFAKGSFFKNDSFSMVSSGAPGPAEVATLEGRLGYIYHTKLKYDLRDSEERHRNPSSVAKLYRKFLFWSFFIANQKPLVLCEGKTDSVYLKCAIRQLTAFQPDLGQIVKGQFCYNVDFLNYSKLVIDVLRLCGGASFLTEFIVHYKKQSAAFYGSVPQQPIIILIDNDDGAKSIFSVCKAKKIPIIPSLSSTAPFYYISDNLYLVKTEKAGAVKTCIEDCFDTSTKNIKVDGKVFNPAKEHEAPGEYGKAIFAHQVVRPNATKIDFAKFTVLLQRLQAARDNFYHRLSSHTLI